MNLQKGGLYGVKIGNLACFCGHRPDTDRQEISLLSVQEVEPAADTSALPDSDRAPAPKLEVEVSEARKPADTGPAPAAKIEVFGEVLTGDTGVRNRGLAEVATDSSQQQRGTKAPAAAAAQEVARAPAAQAGNVQQTEPPATKGISQPSAVIHSGSSAGSSSAIAPKAEETIASLYLNLLVVSKNAAFETGIAEKLKGKVPNPFGGGGIERFFGHAISTLVGTDKIAAKLAAQMPAELPQKMAQLGITAAAEEVFRKDSFVVVRIKVIKCDLHRLISAKFGEQKAQTADKRLGCLKGIAHICCSQDRIDNKYERTVNEKIVQGMCEKLPEALPQKMAEKGLDVDVVTKSTEAQAAYFFDFLAHLNAGSSIPSSGNAPAQKDNRAVLYLNILVASKTEQFEAMVTEKLKDKVPNPFGRGVLQKMVGHLAAGVVTTDKIAAKMAQGMPASLPSKLAEAGIQADAKEVFRNGAFVIVKISIIHCDLEKMIGSKGDEAKARKVGRAIGCAKCLAGAAGSKERLENKMDHKLNETVVQGMSKKLQETLPTQMAEKGLIVDVVVNSEADQADYFFNFLSSSGLGHAH